MKRDDVLKWVNKKRPKDGNRTKLEDELLAQIRWASLPEPVREFKFHPTRKWRADFFFADCRLLVEVEGGTWVSGRHNSGAGYESDIEKYNGATLEGWRLIRCTGKHIKSGQALKWIEEMLKQTKEEDAKR